MMTDPQTTVTLTFAHPTPMDPLDVLNRVCAALNNRELHTPGDGRSLYLRAMATSPVVTT